MDGCSSIARAMNGINEATNEVKAVYCSSAMTEFEESFVEYEEWERANG